MDFDFVNFLIQNALLYCLIVTGEIMVFTLCFHRMIGKWWWTREDLNEPYKIEVGAGYISLKLRGSNPLEALKAAYADLTGANRTVEDRIDAELRQAEKEIVESAIMDEVNRKEYRDRMTVLVHERMRRKYVTEDEIKDELRGYR